VAVIQIVGNLAGLQPASGKTSVAAALLTGDIPGRNFKRKDNLVEHQEDCRRMNVHIVPPDVNCSGREFTVSDDKIHFAAARFTSGDRFGGEID